MNPDILFYQQNYTVLLPQKAAPVVISFGWFQQPEQMLVEQDQPQLTEYVVTVQVPVVLQVNLGWLQLPEEPPLATEPYGADPAYVIPARVSIDLGWFQLPQQPEIFDAGLDQFIPEVIRVAIVVPVPAFGWYQQVEPDHYVPELKLDLIYELHGIGVIYVPVVPMGWFQQLDQPNPMELLDYTMPSFHRTIDLPNDFEPIRRKVGLGQPPEPLNRPYVRGEEPL